MSGELEKSDGRGLVAQPRQRRLRDKYDETGRPRQPGELHPEFIMVGTDVPAGKRVYASKDLSRSAFEVAVSQAGDAEGWHLTSTLARMLIVTKPTYGEAMAEVLRIWQNWLNNERELWERPSPAQRQLENGI